MKPITYMKRTTKNFVYDNVFYTFHKHKQIYQLIKDRISELKQRLI